MNVTLAPELEEIVHQKVASGEYASTSDVLNHALRLLLDEEEEPRTEEELRREIALGVEALERGEYITLNSDEELAAFFEQLKAEGRARRAESEKKSA